MRARWKWALTWPGLCPGGHARSSAGQMPSGQAPPSPRKILLGYGIFRDMGLKYAHIAMRTVLAMPDVPTAASKRGPASRHSAKRATNLSLSVDVLDAAKALGLNISQVCDNHLRDVVRREQARRWRVEHADFIAAYNATVEAEGLPLDEWKTF